MAPGNSGDRALGLNRWTVRRALLQIILDIGLSFKMGCGWNIRGKSRFRSSRQSSRFSNVNANL